MEFRFEVQNQREKKSAVDEALSRLQSDLLDESYLYEDVQEYYVGYIEGTVSDNTVWAIKLMLFANWRLTN